MSFKESEQLPPNFGTKKLMEPGHKLARAGKEVELKPKITIESIKLIHFSKERIKSK